MRLTRSTQISFFILIYTLSSILVVASVPIFCDCVSAKKLLQLQAVKTHSGTNWGLLVRQTDLLKLQPEKPNRSLLKDSRVWIFVATVELIYSIFNFIDAVSGIVEKAGVIHNYLTTDQALDQPPDSITVANTIKAILRLIANKIFHTGLQVTSK